MLMNFYIVYNHKEIFFIAFSAKAFTLPLIILETCSILIIYRNLFLRTPFPWPQTGGWLLCRSHMPEEQRQMGKSAKTGEW